ncbi:MAG: 50S ribosomal protein L29 [Mucinivorans sp.]
MKTAEINELTVGELQERILTEKSLLQQAKMNHSVSPAEDTSTTRKSRRIIARMLTILNQKQNS